MIKAVIFDMDGLIVDSESLQSKAFEIMVGRHGKKPVMNNDGVVQTIGIGDRDNWKLLKKKYNINDKLEKLIEKRNRIYIDLLKRNLKPMPGFFKLINIFKENKLKMAIASSSVTKQIKIVISKLKIKDYINTIVSGEQAKRAKPYPDIFLMASKKLKTKPELCLVLEDSQPGVEAARKAGMKVIAVPNRFTKNHDFSKANLVVISLKNIDIEIINSV